MGPIQLRFTPEDSIGFGCTAWPSGKTECRIAVFAGSEAHELIELFLRVVGVASINRVVISVGDVHYVFNDVLRLAQSFQLDRNSDEPPNYIPSEHRCEYTLAIRKEVPQKRSRRPSCSGGASRITSTGPSERAASDCKLTAANGAYEEQCRAFIDTAIIRLFV
jgi:hypothetical protein